jgi:hypothetical protein
MQEVPDSELELREDHPFRVTSSGLQVTPSVRTGGACMKPDFVMVGVQNGAGGVLLFASMTLSSAELRREVDRDDPFDYVDTGHGVARLPKERISVTAEMRDFTLIHAESYGAAIKTLHEQWSRKAQVPGNALPPGF